MNPGHGPEIRAVSFDRRFLKESFRWLQDPDLRWSLIADEVDAESQQSWFDGLAHRTDYAIWGIAADGLPVGVLGLKKIVAGESAEWFMYVAEARHRGTGIGDWAADEICRLARARGIRELWGVSREDNLPILRLLHRNGFLVEAAGADGLVRSSKAL